MISGFLSLPPFGEVKPFKPNSPDRGTPASERVGVNRKGL
jgi:hypothetical protein